MWQSKTKRDLIIEVWEKMDCENVGREEIEAIEKAVREKIGNRAVETPMIIARQLAEEGAELRHSEILKLDVERRLKSFYAPIFLDFSDLEQTLRTIRRLETLRRKFLKDNDKEGLHLVKETAIKGKKEASEMAKSKVLKRQKRNEKAEIAEWFAIWLQSPEVFENWVKLRKNSKEFRDNFPSKRK